MNTPLCDDGVRSPLFTRTHTQKRILTHTNTDKPTLSRVTGASDVIPLPPTAPVWLLRAVINSTHGDDKCLRSSVSLDTHTHTNAQTLDYGSSHSIDLFFSSSVSFKRVLIFISALM